MPQGLQIFDSSGNCILDITDRLSKIIGVIQSGGTSGTYVDTELTQGTPFLIVKVNDPNYMSNIASMFSATVSGTTISWSFIQNDQLNNNYNREITYGVF